MRYLITGASGFVGSKMCKHLIDNTRHEVVGAYRKKTDFVPPKSLKDINDGRFGDCHLDLRDSASVRQVIDYVAPDVVIHLGAQSYVPESFTNPEETFYTNTVGTHNLLESIRQTTTCSPVFVFAGSSEEYGLVITSEKQHERIEEKYGNIYPRWNNKSECPINEDNPLRPMSPYAVTKIAGEAECRNSRATFGIKTVCSRAFNHEGAGRGMNFVTSNIVKQVLDVASGKEKKIMIGNVNACRDWSHVNTMIDGYLAMSTLGRYGDVFNQCSGRTNSILSYILLTISNLGYDISKLHTMDDKIEIEEPIATTDDKIFGISFLRTLVDDKILNGDIEFSLANKGIVVETDIKDFHICFDKKRYRDSEVPILLGSNKKLIEAVDGIKTIRRYSLDDIIKEQIKWLS
jgi:GDPmannose 4,6-dehydratase